MTTKGSKMATRAFQIEMQLLETGLYRATAVTYDKRQSMPAAPGPEALASAMRHIYTSIFEPDMLTATIEVTVHSDEVVLPQCYMHTREGLRCQIQAHKRVVVVTEHGTRQIPVCPMHSSVELVQTRFGL